MWFVLICCATWFVMAGLLWLVHPLLGVGGIIFAALLSEALLIAHRAEQSSENDRFLQPK